MPTHSDRPQPIVPADLFDAAKAAIQRAKQDTRYPHLLDAKLGDADVAPITDAQLASTYDTSLSSLNRRVAEAMRALAGADQQLGCPLAKIAQRVNHRMAQAAVINRHNRRPPLYAESTIKTFLDLDWAIPEHAPLIRAAGHVVPPPVVPMDHDVSFLISDIAWHLTRSREPQRIEQIRDALRHRQKALERWAQLDLTLFIFRVSGLTPDDSGRFNPDPTWGNFVGRRRLVADTMVHILTREEQPLSTKYLVYEIHRLVGRFLPDGYDLREAVKNIASTSEEISWQGLATFGLRKWNNGSNVRKSGRRGRTSDLVYHFLVNRGPADVEDVIQHVQSVSKAKKGTIQDAVNRDPANRFLKLTNGKVMINPFPQDLNPDSQNLVVVPDDARRRPPPVLRESELAWLTHYVRALNALEPPLPLRVVISGQRAAGFALDDGVNITVVADKRHLGSLEPRLQQLAAATSNQVTSVPVMVGVVSTEEWDRRRAGSEPEPYHNVWLAPDAAP